MQIASIQMVRPVKGRRRCVSAWWQFWVRGRGVEETVMWWTHGVAVDDDGGGGGGGEPQV